MKNEKKNEKNNKYKTKTKTEKNGFFINIKIK